jgi:glycerophosphoryl diester phosphodiesterase
MAEPASLASFRRPSGLRPFVLGHRGARHAAPENTMRAFELALTEGAEGVELDVRVDGDGRVIVLHDADLARLTAGADQRKAHQISAASLGLVRIGGEPVPTLAEVLAWAAERGARVNVELKSDVPSLAELAAAVLRDVTRSGASPEAIFFSSFHPRLVRALAAGLPEFCSCWLVHARQRPFRSAPLFRALGAVGVHPEHSLVTPERMAVWKRAGALINTWTVNDVDVARRLSELGVDAIISDNPGAILQALPGAAPA